MATWFTADTHFGHVRIIELSRRPFDDVRAMDEALVQNWNERVAPDDTIWHVGDFAFGRDDARIDALFGRLNGTKHLVIGNHDVDNEAILTLPLASVSDIASTLVDTQHVTMCHYPMRTWPKARKGAMHLHGHMHGKLKGTDRSLDVGVDAWRFRPVCLAEIRRRLRTLPRDPAFADEAAANRAADAGPGSKA